MSSKTTTWHPLTELKDAIVWYLSTNQTNLLCSHVLIEIHCTFHSSQILILIQQMNYRPTVSVLLCLPFACSILNRKTVSLSTACGIRWSPTRGIWLSMKGKILLLFLQWKDCHDEKLCFRSIKKNNGGSWGLLSNTPFCLTWSACLSVRVCIMCLVCLIFAMF